ncbi:geminin [Dendroctonus ponderosae]
MKTEQSKKVVISVDTDVQQENAKNVRRGLKTLQPTSIDKENLAGRSLPKKDNKILNNAESKPKPMLINKETQTEKYILNIDDLTGEEPSAEYWKALAETRQESIDEIMHEVEKLKGNISVLQEENKICKAMLEESRTLVKVFKEMLEDEDETPDQVAAAETDCS